MKYASTADFMLALFDGQMTRRTIVERLFSNSDVAAIASEHGADREQILRTLDGADASDAGARLRLAVETMRSTGAAPVGKAFPERLDMATDGALELIGLFVNPMMTTAMILGTPAPSFEEAGRAIDPQLSLAHYASRVFRVLAVQHPELAPALTNAAGALERA